MGTVSRSLLWKSDATQPMSTILIDTGGNDCPKLAVTADTANLMPGLVCTMTATTGIHDMTESGAVSGNTAQNAVLYIVELEPDTPYQNGQYVLTTAYAENDPITVYELKKGMKVWIKGSSLTCSENELLVPAANGLWARVGDPDGEAIDQRCHIMRALTALSSGTWVPAKYEGIGTLDKTA